MKKALTVVLLLFGWACVGTTDSAPKAQLDEYGGSTRLQCSSATGFFHTQKIGNRWWLCDPLGNVFFVVGVGGVTVGVSETGRPGPMGKTYNQIVIGKYGDKNIHWAPQQNRRLLSWGFNTVGQDSDRWALPWASCKGSENCDWPNGEQPVKLPAITELPVSNYAAFNLNNHASQATKDMLWGLNGNYKAWRASLVDFYDPKYQQFLDVYLGPKGANISSNNWRIGEFIDDSDWFWGSGAGLDFHSIPPGHTNCDIGYMVMITSPAQTYNRSPVQRGVQELYAADTLVHSKAQALNPSSRCSLPNPCSLRDYLWLKYGRNISRLNAAWGSNYTTFDSTGVLVTGELAATADGTTTEFTHTLAHTPVSPETVLIREASKAIGGDCPWFQGPCGMAQPNTGALSSPAKEIAGGDPPWLTDPTSQSCGCDTPAQEISFKLTYHMKPGQFAIPSREVGVNTAAGQVAVVRSPAANPNATGYDVYAVAQARGLPWRDIAGRETLQARNVPFGTNWVEPNTGIASGGPAPPSPPSTVDYSNGQVRIAFPRPPARGTRITVDYVYNGWMYGTGLMDEDGRHSSWLGTNPYCLQPNPTDPYFSCDGKDNPLPNANPAVGADLDGWIPQFSAQYFKTVRTEWNKYAPHNLYLGLDNIGSWGVPARKEVLQGAAPYIDGMFTSFLPTRPEGRAMLQYMTQWLGDLPIINSAGEGATSDSALWRNARAGNTTTQDERGQNYVASMKDILSWKSYNNDYQFIGSIWWGLLDFQNEGVAFGMVSSEDNPYDGKSAVRAAGVDQWGYPTGGEEKDYGDFIDYAKQANSMWLELLNQPTHAQNRPFRSRQ